MSCNALADHVCNLCVLRSLWSCNAIADHVCNLCGLRSLWSCNAYFLGAMAFRLTVNKNCRYTLAKRCDAESVGAKVCQFRTSKFSGKFRAEALEKQNILRFLRLVLSRLAAQVRAVL